MNQNVLVGGIAFAVVLSIIAFFQGGPQGLQGPQGPEGYGAVSVLNSPLEVNGAQIFVSRLNFRTGSSTVCSFKTPVATTTGTIAVYGGTGLSFAQEYEIAVGTTPNATSTLSLGKLYVPANGSDSVVATTTTAESLRFAPNVYINVKMATSAVISTALAPKGSCSSSLLRI